MDVFRRLPPADQRVACALTIGNFDGVHRGHQEVLARLRRRADELGVPTCVLTFEPHPREYFASLSGDASFVPPRILTERDKLDALAEHGVDRVCIAHFNASVAQQPAQAFVEEVIVRGLHARHLLIGDDFRFGAKRQGSFETLAREATRLGFELARMDTVLERGERVSSSSVRAALAAGDFSRAYELLGRPYFISGHVVHGRQLGRKLGYPTMNLRIPFAKPALAGVFVVRVHGVDAAPLPAVASLGTRPAVERDGQLLLEVHILDFQGDLYGRMVRVEFLRRLRDEMHFDGLPALTAQIRADEQAAREYFRDK
jgi:riboflavin kinase / FMN adenylyltransferase